MTARSTVGWMVPESPTPCSASRAIASCCRERCDVDLDEVGLDAVGVDRKPGLGEAARKPLRPRVVVGQAVDVVVERVDTGRRDDPGLAHRAAEEVLQPTRVAHHLGVAGKDRAERAAEPLREAERDGVEPRSDLGRLDAERDGRVQQPGAVEMKAEVELEREGVQLVDLLQRPDPPAARVVGVLDPEQARPRRVDRGGAMGRADLVGAVAAGDAGKPAGDDAGVDRRSAELGDEDVAVLLAEQLVAELGVQPDRDLVRHRRGRQEDRLVLAEQARRTLLELVDGRVLALLLVAHSGRGDRGSHSRRRPGRRVGTEVDHACSLALDPP